MKIRIEEELCKGCGYCIEICSKNIFQESDKINKKGYMIPKISENDSCIGCKKCELICPEMAVEVEKEEK